MTLRFLGSNAQKYSKIDNEDKPPSHDKLEDLISEACPDILWTVRGRDKIKAENLPSLQHLALQRNIWARKRTTMANKRTMLAFVRTGFTLANMAHSWGEQSWAYYGFVFMFFVAIEYIYNIVVITGGVHPTKNVSLGFEYSFDIYAFGLVVIALIVLGYHVE